MKLITNSLTDKLLANGRAQRAAMDKGDDALDFKVSSSVELFELPALARQRRVRGARLRLASRPPAVATSLWQKLDAQCTWLLTD